MDQKVGMIEFHGTESGGDIAGYIAWVPPGSSPTPVIGAAGWVCPKCGSGNSPFLSQCPCGPKHFTISSKENWTL